MEYLEQRDAILALKAIAEAFREQNKQNERWIETQTQWHEEEQARWQAWRDADVARLTRLEQQALAQHEADIRLILADWKEQGKGALHLQQERGRFLLRTAYQEQQEQKVHAQIASYTAGHQFADMTHILSVYEEAALALIDDLQEKGA